MVKTPNSPSPDDELKSISLSWDSELSIEFLNQNSDAIARAYPSILSFFDRISGPGNEKRETTAENDVTRCQTCLGLDWTLYKDEIFISVHTPRTHTVRFHELRISGRRGCEICLVLFNGTAHFCGEKYDKMDFVEIILGRVHINVWQDRIPSVIVDRKLDAILEVEFFSPTGIPKSLRVYMLSGLTFSGFPSPLDVFGPSANIPMLLDVEQCLSFVRPLIEECAHSHQVSCPPRTPQELPKRFLDVGTELSPSVKLVSAAQIKQNDLLKYTALSHYWGKGGRLLQTSTQNIEQHFHSIAWDDFCKTFQDAIMITRGLGIQYLWIDSICILQDDVSDWKIESANFANIYANSYLTISAMGSASGSGCLFPRWITFGGRMPRSEILVLSETYNGMPSKIYARNASFDAHGEFTNDAIRNERTSPLLSRAWCFQDRLLSNRIIHFHAEEMVWECGSSLACECGYLKGSADVDVHPFKSNSCRRQTHRVFNGPKSRHQVFNTWLNIVQRYSGLALSNETGRLEAIAGLASRFQQELGGQYLAGLWYDDLPRALLWNRIRNKTRRKMDSTGAKIPTWSWASIENLEKPTEGVSSVSYFGIFELKVDPRVQIIKVSSPILDGQPDFTAPGSSISIRGACIFTKLVELGGLLVCFDVYNEEIPKEVTYLLLGVGTDGSYSGWLHFLVLWKLPVGKFERVGKGALNPSKIDWFQDVASTEVEII